MELNKKRKRKVIAEKRDKLYKRPHILFYVISLDKTYDNNKKLGTVNNFV